MNPRGRPRDPMIDDKVTTATLTLLAANGYSGLRVDDVARTSGVAKTTIYRRWPSLASLAVEAVARSIGDRTFIPTDDPVSDLRAVCAMLASSINTSSSSWLAVALDLQQHNDQALRTYYRERIIDPPRLMLIEALTRVQQAGRLSPAASPDGWATFLIGAAIYQVVVLHDPMTPTTVSDVLDGIITTP